MNSLHKKIPRKAFGNSAKNVLLQEHTSISGNKIRITFDIDLGEPAFLKSSEKVSGAEGKEFKNISWTNLILSHLPNGISYRNLGQPGEPEIPALAITMAIPEGAQNMTAFEEKNISASSKNIFLLPKGDSKGERKYLMGTYGVYNFYKSSLSSPAKIRTMNIISITIPLVEFNSQTGNIQAKKKFTCGINFTVPQQFISQKNISDPVFEELYTRTVANPSDIFRFRSGFHSFQNSKKDQPLTFNKPTFDKTITAWIDPSAPYIKLYATRTGLYRVTSAMISAKFPDIANWRAREARMFNKGKEIPIWIDSTSDGKINAIEYFGERLPGLPGEFFNWDSDSNAYWFTNSRKFQTSPLRFIDKVVAGNPPVTITDGNIVLHHEQDNFYYGGDDFPDQTNTLHRTEWVLGERFVWRFLPSAQNVFDTFTIASLPSDLSQNATVVVFLRGASSDLGNGNSVTHGAQIRINGQDVSDPTFINYDDMRDTFKIPVSALHVGQNTFQLSYVAVPGGNSPDVWYFDYYSVSLPAGLAPSSDTAITSGQWDFTLNNSQQENISLQSTASPHLFNLTDGTRLLPSGTNGIFSESAIGSNRYVGATPFSFLTPDRIDTVVSRFASILDTAQGADYIVIAHPLFFTAAQKLAVLRQQISGLRTRVVTTDDIFNAFNFGSDEPWALRRYLQYAFDFYHGTPPAFVTLFGEGTWDPKFILNNPLQDIGSRTIHHSFVPTFGVPNSDYIFTTAEGSTWLDTSTFRMVISRIPAESAQDADDYLNKLVEYETGVPAAWNKNFLFITGGDPGSQASRLSEDVHAFVGDPTSFPFFLGTPNVYGGLGNPPVSINPTFIQRQDMVNQIDVTQIPAIQSAFQTGQALVYFFGHGAPNITDIQFPDVGSLRNKTLYPVLITVSCRAGAFGEPNIISLDEGYIKAPEEGAIMSYGTTGFSAEDYDFDMSALIFNFLRGDSVMARTHALGPHRLNMPIIFTTSKFIETVIVKGINFPDASTHNNLFEYSILGDAGLGFSLRPEPEFNITPSDIILAAKDSIPRTVFSLSDSEITIKYGVRNFGYGIDKPVHIKITDKEPGGKQIVLIDSIESLERIAMSGVVLSLDSFAIGSNTLDIFVDYDDGFPNEENKKDNEASVTFLVNGASATPFYPPEGSKFFCDITPDSVHVSLLLPHTANGAPVGIEIQFDTTNAFTSPKIFSGLQGTGLFFQKSFARSSLPNPASHVLWWRSRITLPGGNQSTFAVQSFSTESPVPPGARPEFSYTTGDQLAGTIRSDLKVDTDGALIIPANDTVNYEVDARGYLDQNVVDLRPIGEVIINKTVFLQNASGGYLPDGAFIPLSLFVATPDSSNIETIFNFLRGTPPDSFISVVNSIPAGRRVFILTNFDPNVHDPNILPWFGNSGVKAALQSLGSLNGIDSLDHGWSYALIGRKGMQPGQGIEKFGHAGSFGATVTDRTITLGTNGFAQTPQTAVATGYGKLKWKVQNVDASSTIHFVVFGVRKNGGAIDTVLKVDAASGTSADLSVNPAAFYDRMFVQMNFQRSSSASVSPRLYGIELEYDPAPEFFIDGKALVVIPDTTIEGSPVTAKYTVQNVTCVDGNNVPVQLVQIFQGKSVTIASDTIKNFPGHSSVTFSHQIPTTGFLGDVNLISTVNPGGLLNEQLTFNNSSSAIYTVIRDTNRPKLDLVFDGRHINSGDYVSAKVKIEIRLLSNNPIRVSDSASVKGVLQPLFGTSGPISFTGGLKTAGFTTTVSLPSSGVIQETLDIQKDSLLVPGKYLFTAMGNDASGNRADTISTQFVVSAVNGIDKVMNYPNPFKDKTWFTFILKNGSQADVKVVIYTVAGRKIRTLHLDPANQHAGLNNIEWDGRDEMGNDVANGTYLYRVVLNGTNDDGSPSSDATTERAVRSR